MYVQGVDKVYDLNFNGREGADKVTYGDVFMQAEQEYSRHNFEFADPAMLLRHFEDAEKECEALLKAGAAKSVISPLEGEMPGRAEGCLSRQPQSPPSVAFGDISPSRGEISQSQTHHRMVFPAYDQCIKASHVFNLLDARGVISVTERQSYILRVRNLARQCGEAFLLTEAGGLAA